MPPYFGVALRYLTERLDRAAITTTPSGLVRVDASVSKPGVYKYYGPDGKVTREYLPPEEIARADSLASLEDVPVTIRHPQNMVDPSTWKAVSVGHARNARTDAGRALATLVIGPSEAQSKIGTELVEVSRGVRVRVDHTPGITPEGEHYDAVQRDVVYNHIALGPRGWGRQGPDVSLRLDSAGDELYDDSESNTMALKYDGKEFKNDAELAAYIDGLKSARADAAPPFPPKKKGEEKDEEEDPKAKEKTDALRAERDALKAKLDAREAADKAAARAALETRARAVLGTSYKADSADTERSIQLAALAKLTPAVKYDSQSDAYVSAAFDIAIAAAPSSASRSDSLAVALHGAGPGGIVAPALRADGTTEDKRDAQDKMRAGYSESWKQPLAISAK